MKRMTLSQAAKNRQVFRTQFPVKVVREKFTDAAGNPAEKATLKGYPILWNVASSDRGGYVVKLAPNSALFTAPVMALFHHNFAAPLGTTDNGTLRIGAADDKGVPIEIDLNMATSIGRDVAAWVDRGDIKGMSFAMANGFESYTESKEDGMTVVTCQKYTVDEVTVTGIPAFAQTSIAVKASEDDTDDDDEENNPVQSSAAQHKNRITASLKHAANKLYLLQPAR